MDETLRRLSRFVSLTEAFSGTPTRARLRLGAVETPPPAPIGPLVDTRRTMPFSATWRPADRVNGAGEVAAELSMWIGREATPRPTCGTKHHAPFAPQYSFDVPCILSHQIRLCEPARAPGKPGNT